MITLDSVLQGPGSPKEDTSGGFEYGGWVAPYDDEVYDAVVREELKPADYLLGRKTFEIWEDYWPEHAEIWPGINDGMKYVMSTTRNSTEWQNTMFIDQWLISKTSKIRPDRTSRYGGVVNWPSCCFRTTWWMNSDSKFIR